MIPPPLPPPPGVNPLTEETIREEIVTTFPGIPTNVLNVKDVTVTVLPIKVEYNTVDTVSVEFTVSELVISPAVVMVDPVNVE